MQIELNNRILKNQNLSNQLKLSAEAQILIVTLDTFSKTLKNYGFNIPATSPKSLECLRSLPSEKISMMTMAFQTWMSFIIPSASAGELIDLENEKEILFAKKALIHFGMNVSDEFWATVTNDHVIEIYGPNMTQLYRSLNFFNHCVYSLLDLATTEWYELYERPRLVIENMMKDAVECFTNYHSVKKVNIGKHVVRQIMNNGLQAPNEKIATLVEFQHIGSLTNNPLSKKPTGIIVTCTSEIIGRNEEAADIEFV